MKLKRQKKTRKVLQYYKLHHNIVPPYKVVCDSEFLQAALLGRVQLKQQLPRTLQLENTLVSHIKNTMQNQRNNIQNNTDSTVPNTVQSINITRCILRTIEEKGNLYGGALHIAKTLTFLSCRHKSKHASEFDCIHALVQNNNNDRLVCGLNDRTIRHSIRALGHTPVLFIRDNVVLIEQPTERSKTELQHDTLQQINTLQSDESTVVKQLETVDTPRTAGKPKPVKKAAKGPNPLSVKKKKVHLTKEQRLSLKAAKETSTGTVNLNATNNDITTINDVIADSTATDIAPRDNIIDGTRKRKRSRHRRKHVDHNHTADNTHTELSEQAD